VAAWGCCPATGFLEKVGADNDMGTTMAFHHLHVYLDDPEDWLARYGEL